MTMIEEFTPVTVGKGKKIHLATGNNSVKCGGSSGGNNNFNSHLRVIDISNPYYAHYEKCKNCFKEGI